MANHLKSQLTFLIFINCFQVIFSISSLENQLIFSLEQIGNPYAIDMMFNEKQSFQVFKSIENKIYLSPEEQAYRFLVFQQNLQLVNNHNFNVINKLSLDQMGNKIQNLNRFSMKLNKFADLTDLQFRQLYTMTYATTEQVKKKVDLLLNINTSEQNQKKNPCTNTFPSIDAQNLRQKQIQRLDKQILKYVKQKQAQKVKVHNLSKIINNNSNSQTNNNLNNQINSAAINNNGDSNSNSKGNSRNLQQLLPQNISIDWTKHSGAIKFQGICGSCYAFATVDAVSSLNSIFKFGLFIPLSIQQIIDCTNNGMTFGCKGGFMQGALTYIQTNGVTTDFAYKYTGVQSTKCNQNTGTFKIASFKNIQSSCQAIIQALKIKPLAIAIAGFRLKFYSSGLFDDCNQYVDHAVLLIGYKSGIGWKIKNSWGKDWGMNGFAWIKQGSRCGICTNAISATVQEQLIKN